MKRIKINFLCWCLFCLDNGTCDYSAKSSSITSSFSLSSSGSCLRGATALFFPYPIRFFRRLLYICALACVTTPCSILFSSGYFLFDFFAVFLLFFSYITDINHYTYTSLFLVFSPWTTMLDHLSCLFSSSQPHTCFSFLLSSLSITNSLSISLYNFITFTSVTWHVFIFLTCEYFNFFLNSRLTSLSFLE